MKIIIKNVYLCSAGNDKYPIIILIEPEKIILTHFALQYLNQLNKRVKCIVDIYKTDPTQIKMERDLIFSDFDFYFSGRSYSARRTPNKLLSDIIKESNLQNNESITVYSNLSISNGKIHISAPTLFQLSIFKIKDMLNEEDISKEDIQNNLLKDTVVPEEIKKLII